MDNEDKIKKLAELVEALQDAYNAAADYANKNGIPWLVENHVDSIYRHVVDQDEKEWIEETCGISVEVGESAWVSSSTFC